MRSRAKGFTLIELMVVVAIIAILTAIAYPAYIDHVRKTRFAQIKEGLQEYTTALERYVSQQASYPAKADVTSKIGSPPYADIFTYDYEPSAAAGAAAGSNLTLYTITVTEKDSRFGLWAGVNGQGVSGTHCGCDGKICKASDNPTFSSTLSACSDPSKAF
jgi:prepilin-type N-terminal cleavage/methylation domain-containing protein